MTLLNPVKSMAAAKCTAWSGCVLSPFAVSHALRTARNAFERSSSINRATVSMPSCNAKPLSNG